MTGYPAIGASYAPTDTLSYDTLKNKYYTDSISYSNPVLPTDSTGTSNVSFNGGGSGTTTNNLPPVEESKGLNPYVVTGGAATLILGAVCFAKGKGNTGFLNRMKAGWNAIMPDFLKIGEKAAEKAAEKVGKKAAASTPRNVANLVNGAQEYTIVKDGLTVVMKGGKPVSITTSTRETITNPNKIKTYLSENTELAQTIEGFGIKKGKQLPDTVKLVYQRKIGNHTYLVENGKIVEVIGTAKGGGAKHSIKGEELTKFLEKHASEAEKATSLTRTITGKKIEGVAEAADEIVVTASNGKVLSAKINGKDLSKEQLEKLYSAYKQEIKAFGRDAGSTYNGLTSYHYKYTNRGNVYTINGDGKTLVGVEHSVPGKPITATKEIENFLRNNKTLQGELDGIVSSGTLPEGARFGNIEVKTEDGIVCIIGGNGHKLERVTLANGAKLEGDTLKAWRETAENENSISKILEMIK